MGRLFNMFNFPVNEVEMVAFEKVTDVVQSIIFYRWQLRAFAKLLTGLVLLTSPFVLQRTG